MRQRSDISTISSESMRPGNIIVADQEVQLEGVLSNFHLPDPPKDDELAKAVQASLRLTEVAPYQITIPLLAGVFRSTIGGVDFSEHLAGPTGAGKSELAALCQQHFGPQMNRLHLPGNCLHCQLARGLSLLS